MDKIYDVAIAGSGQAGMFCALKIAQKYKNIQGVLIDFGRPPQKRRRFLEGAMGALPSSDMKFYQSDLDKVSDIIGKRSCLSANKQVSSALKKVTNIKVVEDKLPKSSLVKLFNSNGFEVLKNDYMQLYPKDIHALSRSVFPEIEEAGNIDFSFDNDIYNIYKKDGLFILECEQGIIKSKKLLLATGRAGWMWYTKLYKQCGIVDSNNVARFGMRIETPASNMKDFNKSNCSIVREDLELGPINWFGTVIPEDHYYFASSEFRSNERRWATKNASFSLIGNVPYSDGAEQADRIAKLTFILTNDRVSKEKISAFLKDKSKVSIIPEYTWFKDKIEELQGIIPNIISNGYMHVPTIKTLPPKINIGKNLETEVDGLFVAGESAGVIGLLAASVMGFHAAVGLCK